MTTTDTDALTERLRERLIETFAQQDPRPEFATVKALKIAHMVAPIVAAEVRKAQADAWDEGQISADKDWTIGGHVRSNPYRAAQYEKENTDG